MDTVEISGQTGRSRILIGARLADLHQYLPDSRIIVITDEIVYGRYGSLFPKTDVITIGCGEKIKTLDTMAFIYDRLVSLEADRDTFLVGIGGGIVGDMTGFAASTYMRGLRFGFVATSLLAQVDAAVGGKNGVNFKGYKNMIGVLNQPEFVIADMKLLRTLPPDEIACGLAEIVKHGCIADAEYFHYIEENTDAIAALNEDVLRTLVRGSVAIKAAVVNRDERETGERRILNFGHTFGHAFEKVLGLSHGAAVSLGMVLAARFSYDRGKFTLDELDRIVQLLEKLKLPVAAAYNRQTVWDALLKDKKRSQAFIHFVLLKKPGRAVVELIPLSELADWFSG